MIIKYFYCYFFIFFIFRYHQIINFNPQDEISPTMQQSRSLPPSDKVSSNHHHHHHPTHKTKAWTVSSVRRRRLPLPRHKPIVRRIWNSWIDWQESSHPKSWRYSRTDSPYSQERTIWHSVVYSLFVVVPFTSLM